MNQFKILTTFILLQITVLSCDDKDHALDKTKTSQLDFDTEKIVGAWVDMWNSYDLHQIEELFLTDSNLTYFSSEKEGLIKGIEAVLEHHKGFGFIKGGKVQDNILWVENLHTTIFNSSIIVTGIWYFKKPTGEVQRGPVTFVYVKKDRLVILTGPFL